MQICLFYHQNTRVGVHSMCVHRQCMMQGKCNSSSPAARLPTHLCKHHKEKVTKKIKIILLWGQPHCLTLAGLHQAIDSFRINWKVNEGKCVWRISFPLVHFAVSNPQTTTRISGLTSCQDLPQPPPGLWHLFGNICKAKIIHCHHKVEKDSKQQFPPYPFSFFKKSLLEVNNLKDLLNVIAQY